MRISGFVLLLFILHSCGTPTKKKQENVIGNEPPPDPEPAEVVIPPKPLPRGAITANFVSGRVPLYAYVKTTDKAKGVTTIAFEDTALPEIDIPKTFGATLSSLRFNEFDSDLLLVTAKLKDPDFNKYFLYKYNGRLWKPVVNGFAIHKSHRPDTLNPIVIDTIDPNFMIRYYSVFDLDRERKTGYTWLLLQERIPIMDTN